MGMSDALKDREYGKFSYRGTSTSGNSVKVTLHDPDIDTSWNQVLASGASPNEVVVIDDPGTGSVSEIYSFMIHAKANDYGDATVWASGGAGSAVVHQCWNDANTGINFNQNTVIPYHIGAGSLVYGDSTTGSLNISAVGCTRVA